MAKTLEQQLTCAQERARTAKTFLTCIGFTAAGFIAMAQSERNVTVDYVIRRDVDGNLHCTCLATVICKHIGACLLEGASYHTNAIPADQYCVTPNPNRQQTEPEPPTSAICWECGDALRTDATDHYCDWCASIMPALLTNAHKPANPEPEPPAAAPQVADFPLLMNIELEVALAEELMESAGFFWDIDDQTWLPKHMPMPRTTNLIEDARPAAREAMALDAGSMAQRAAAALPADRVPEHFSIFAEVAR